MCRFCWPAKFTKKCGCAVCFDPDERFPAGVHAVGNAVLFRCNTCAHYFCLNDSLKPSDFLLYEDLMDFDNPPTLDYEDLISDSPYISDFEGLISDNQYISDE